MSLTPIDLDRLLTLRVAVARVGEAELAGWWNSKGQLADVYDFVARIWPWFPGVDFGHHSGSDSSDLLLVALLPRMARIFARDPSSKEPGIARIRDITEAYLKTHAKVGPDA